MAAFIFQESRVWLHTKDMVGVNITKVRVNALTKKRAIKKLPRLEPGRYWLFVEEEK